MTFEVTKDYTIENLKKKYLNTAKTKKFKGRIMSIIGDVSVIKVGNTKKITEMFTKNNEFIDKTKNANMGKVVKSENNEKFVVTEEHRKIPRKLVEDMKASFKKNPKSLCGLNLSKIDFSGLEKLELRELDLSEIDFSSCKFPDKTDFTGSELKNAKFISAELVDAVFNDNDLSGAGFEGANLKRVKFENVDLRKSDFYGANLRAAEFIEVDLEEAEFTYTNLSYTKLKYVNAKSAKFDQADLSLADIHDSDFRKAEFKNMLFFRTAIHRT